MIAAILRSQGCSLQNPVASMSTLAFVMSSYVCVRVCVYVCLHTGLLVQSRVSPSLLLPSALTDPYWHWLFQDLQRYVCIHTRHRHTDTHLTQTRTVSLLPHRTLSHIRLALCLARVCMFVCLCVMCVSQVVLWDPATCVPVTTLPVPPEVLGQGNTAAFTTLAFLTGAPFLVRT